MALYPPSAVCEQLYRVHKYLRLAWHCRPDKYVGEMNPGDFAIIQLYHIKDAGTQDNPNTYLLHWAEQGVSRGPVFSRNGSTFRDWDPLFRVPIYVANLQEHGITKEQVFSGEFINTIKFWLRPFRARCEENVNELNRDMKNRIDDIAREKTDYLWSLANRSDADRIIMPYEDARIQMKEWEKDRERTQQSLNRYYAPPGL